MDELFGSDGDSDNEQQQNGSTLLEYQLMILEMLMHMTDCVYESANFCPAPTSLSCCALEFPVLCESMVSLNLNLCIFQSLGRAPGRTLTTKDLGPPATPLVAAAIVTGDGQTKKTEAKLI